MKQRTLVLAALIATGAALYLPLPATAQVGVNIVIGTAPPPPRYEVVPAPRRGYVWAPGYWNWDGRRHIWMAGHWERRHPGRVYVRPEWRHERDGWRLDRGGWRREARHERHDRHESHDRRGDRR